jgi:hypothetical protein
METDIVGLCARCLRTHAGKCVKLGLALYVAATPVIQSMHDGVPHDRLRPWVVAGTATSSGASLSATFAYSMPNTMFPGPNFDSTPGYVWEMVKRTPAAERPVPFDLQIAEAPKPTEPDKV